MTLAWNVNIEWDGGTSANLISNPSFETNSLGWSVSAGAFATNTRVSSHSYFGAYAQKLEVTGAGGQLGATFTALATTSTVSIWVYREAGAGNLFLSLRDATTLVYVTNTNASATTGQWQRLVATGATTPGSDYLLQVNVPTGVTCYIDGAQAESASAATPYYDGVVADETSHMLNGRAERGRHSLLQVGANNFTPQGIGECVLTLKNHDGRYDPLNSNSVLYPGVAPGKVVTITVSDGSAIYNVFKGHITNIQPIRGNKGANSKRVKVTVKDGWQWLQDRKVRYAGTANVVTSTAIGAVATAAQYPFATDIYTGVDTIPYWWASNRSAKEEIQTLADSEFGLVWTGADGILYYRRRPYQWLIGSSATWTGAHITDLDFAQPWDVVRNVIQVKVYPTEVIPYTDSSNPYLWRNAKRFKLRPTKSITINAEYTYQGAKTSAINVIAPAAGIDYAGFGNANGTGDNLTASLGVVLTEKGEDAQIVITNNHTTRGVYVTLLQVRGDVLNKTDALTVEKDISGGGTRRTFLLDVPWQQDIETAQLYADYLARFLQDPRGAPTIRTNTQKAGLARQLADLNTVHTLDVTSEGINQVYRRCGAIHTWDVSQQHLIESEIYFETKDESAYWILNTSELDADTMLAF